MDLDPAVMLGVDRIRDAFHAFARKKGWEAEDYRVYMNVNKDWGMFNVEFLARAYGNYTDSTAFEHYDELLDFLEAEFRDEHELYDALNISLRGLEGSLLFAHYPDSGPSIVPIPDSYLNPGAEDFREDFRREHGISRP